MANEKFQSATGVQLGFFSTAFKDDPGALRLVGVDGREELSRLYEFDLLLARHGEPLTEDELASVVSSTCVIAMGNHKGDLVHGVLSEIEHLEGTRGKRSMYAARMRPVSWLMDLGKRSAIYQDLTFPELIEKVLSSYGMSKNRNFQIRIARDARSPKHEYIVQYQESDWAFLSRWMEREGWFYWIENAKDGPVLVIADDNGDATKIDDPSVISYRERNNLATDGVPTIWDLRVKQRRVPATVSVVDYNHRKPAELLFRSAAVDKGGFGHVIHYGDHFKDGAVGDVWAQTRSEELYSRRHVLTGVTDCARFRVGHTFELENHFVADYDGEYLITSVEHEVGLRAEDLRQAADFTGGVAPARQYKARFTAIPLEVPYRPARLTPWPRIHGVINGHIEADTAGDFAQIDDEGRYKVKLPYDFGTVKGLAASRWIRMAQAYAGSGYGSHFPQHKGTEVLLTHIDGDPDRPIIVGAVPNVHSPGPVAAANATQSVTQTASGIRVELEDQA